MPWVHEEPKTIEERVDLLRTFRGRFDLSEDFIYGIFNLDESEVVGDTGLHTRQGKQVREIGYWIHADLAGKGFATEAAGALTKVAFEINQVRRVEIRCDPKNERSAAILMKLEFIAEGVLRSNAEFMGSARDTEVWSLVSQDYPSSLASEAEISAFDVVGEILL
jgi:RimJ/RimL family protein N-acetyltransferase